MNHGYVIQRTDQGGGYVARPGSASAYTHKLEQARIYHGRSDAERDLCPGNETIVYLGSLLEGAQP